MEDVAEIVSSPRVRLRGIKKRFGDVLANDGVDLDLQPGEVHAVLGGNGAGKSTLMNILSGLIVPDAGTIELEGKPISLASPRDALDRGIGMVHQHFHLVEALSAAENLHIGWSETPRIFRGRDTLAKRAAELGERHPELAVDGSAKIWQLSVAEKQRLEILRTLSRGARVLILDEPTAVLSPAETTGLFRLVEALREEGETIVFISHKLPEVLAIADRITVMRQGRVWKTLERAEADAAVLSELIVGEVREVVRGPARPRREAVLVAEGLCADDDRGLRAVDGVDLSLCSGEVVGIAGAAGNGQRELAEALTGLRSIEAGGVSIAGRDLSQGSPRDFIGSGVGFVPEDRLGTGLAPDRSIWRNAVLRDPPIRRRFFFDRPTAKRRSRELIESVQLSTSDNEREVRTLSGGHAQRLLTGREMALASSALILANPTRGLDVGAVSATHTTVLEARDRGIAVLLLSEDLDELFAVCDRILVLYEGRLVFEQEARAENRPAIGRAMSGLAPEPESVHA